MSDEGRKLSPGQMSDVYVTRESYQAKSINNLKPTKDKDIRYSRKRGTKITPDMTEDERYEALKDRTISLTAKTDYAKLEEAERKLESRVSKAINLKDAERKHLFKKLGEEFSVFKPYKNRDVELSFTFSKGNMDESTKTQKRNYESFAKMFTCFDDVIENAIGIEVHNRNEQGYKVDPTLNNVYVLTSAFEDGDNIIPVKLEIKEFKDKGNTLYVAIALNSIKKGEIATVGASKTDVAQTAPSPTIRLADLFAKINPKDTSFLKYVPKQFLESKQPQMSSKSRNALDEAYLAAVEQGDMETAQRMVDEAAKKAGYSRRMWHGAKKGKNFTVFKGWSYFTENQKYAERYTGQNPENLYGVYAKIEHPFDTRTDRKARRDFESAREEYGMGQLGDRGLPDWTDGYDIVDFISENGLDYDAVVLDEGGDLVNGEPVYRGESYVIRDSAQVKSADPVTYDDDGKIIPLSERFNLEKADIRYSIEIDPEVAARFSQEGIDKRQVSELLNENEVLKQRLKKAKAQIKTSDRTQPREEDVRRMANDLLKVYKSNADKRQTTDALRDLAHTAMSNDIRWTDVRDQAVKLAGPEGPL